MPDPGVACGLHPGLRKETSHCPAAEPGAPSIRRASAPTRDEGFGGYHASFALSRLETNPPGPLIWVYKRCPRLRPSLTVNASFLTLSSGRAAYRRARPPEAARHCLSLKVLLKKPEDGGFAIIPTEEGLLKRATPLRGKPHKVTPPTPQGGSDSSLSPVDCIRRITKPAFSKTPITRYSGRERCFARGLFCAYYLLGSLTYINH